MEYNHDRVKKAYDKGHRVWIRGTDGSKQSCIPRWNKCDEYGSVLDKDIVSEAITDRHTEIKAMYDANPEQYYAHRWDVSSRVWVGIAIPSFDDDSYTWALLNRHDLMIAKTSFSINHVKSSLLDGCTK